jgi:hypothetical protein
MVAQRRWLLALWLCVLSSWALTEGISHDDAVSLDDTLGESVGGDGDGYGYFCTPKGQMRPDYGYNDKDCSADGKTQQCGETWCCKMQNGHYSCPRTNRVDTKHCAPQAQPVCSGPVPTGQADGAKVSVCKDTHDAICAAAKAYGHCKHSTYAEECPAACGACQKAVDGASVKSVIAQVEAKEQIKKLEDHDDASKVAKNAAAKMNKKVAEADAARDDVSEESAEVKKAKDKLKSTEKKAAATVIKAAGAGEAKVQRVKKRAATEVAEEKKEVKSLKAKADSDGKTEKNTEEKLRGAEERADSANTDKAGLVETKAKLTKAESMVAAEKNKLEKDKAMVAHASGSIVAQVAKDKKVVREERRTYETKKDARSEAENKVADAVAQVSQLRGQVRQEGPDEQQVMIERQKLEKAEQKLHHAEEAETVVKEQEDTLEGEIKSEKHVVQVDKDDIPKAVAAATATAKKDQATNEKTLLAKDEIAEEKKLEAKAEMKVKEIAIEHKKDAALKQEEEERIIWTDSDLKARAEGAFVKAEEHVDQIFDNLKPLVQNLQDAAEPESPSPGSNSTETDLDMTVTPEEVAKGMENTPQVDGGDSADGVAKTMVENMVQAKEMMANARTKINKLQQTVDDDDLTVDVPKEIMVEAKATAQKEGDKIAEKLAEEESEKEGKDEEKKLVKAATDKAEGKVTEAEDAEQKTEQQADIVKDKVTESEAQVRSKKDDVEDLKEDVQMAENQMKQDAIPKKTLESAMADARNAKRKLRTATASVRSARAGVKKAKSAVSTAKEEAHVQKTADDKKIRDIEADAEEKVEAAQSKTEDVMAEVKTEKVKLKGAERVKAKVARLRANKNAEKAELKQIKKDERSAKEELEATRAKNEAKVEKAEDNEAAVEKRAIRNAKSRGKRSIKAAKAALKETEAALQRTEKAAEAAGSVAGTAAKVCKKLIPPNLGSKDDASMCATVAKENHCTFFDYARYCAKSCGTCII